MNKKENQTFTELIVVLSMILLSIRPISGGC